MSSDGSRKGEITAGAGSFREDQVLSAAEHFLLQDLKGGQFLQSSFYGIERGDYFMG